MAVNKKMKSIPPGDQLSLFHVQSAGGEPEAWEGKCGSDFINPNADRLYVGDLSLKEHLTGNDFGWVLRLGLYLAGLDWSFFESKYNPAGRRPLHPKIILGLILYGMIEGIWSLRGLERLSAKDVCAWYLCGGQIPDHSTIGKFILRHEEVLCEEFFKAVLADISRELNLKMDEVSGDGTVIEARASHYKTLREEAARGAAEEAIKEARAHPADVKLSEKAQRLSEASEEASRRAAQRRQCGKEPSGVKISPTEPEAVVQPLKNKTHRPSYKPVILANADRFIVGQRVEASNEIEGARILLERYSELTGEKLKCGMFDAGFHTFDILRLGLEHELDLLIPSGKADAGTWKRKGKDGQKYVKQDFVYDEGQDVYVCPLGKELSYKDSYKTVKGEPVRRYRCGDSRNCPNRDKCTSSTRGRSIKRYEDDKLKEAMERVMSQEGARRRYKKRQGMVEPVFGYLTQNQRLKRFHRFGLSKVRLEFALHAVAYNLGRALKVFGMLKGDVIDQTSGKQSSFIIFFAFSVETEVNLIFTTFSTD